MSDLFDSWRMCRTMCHERGDRCWFPVQLPWSRMRRRKPRRIVYSAEFVGSLLDLEWGASRG